ncbi:hypothetical protein PO878_04115 [Iamia majanohamensis]|uniref:Uncharacterized protein n=1 Tax=Iamia majanohamensis TaxID=467976 RepID=A0AAE9YB68_9ACTN|nr:hypothetical protein [Iamia majanohamensis]WCO67908.1 hypothetical protein PO878_04115 [Iamia majanohamensis]
MKADQAEALRKEFPATAIGKLPRAGIHLDYVGHAAVTDRLLAVDPEWTWEPVAFADDGSPLIVTRGKDAELWVRLTVCGVTRYGVGTAPSGSFELAKQLISDAIRNAAMRFGVALDLWSKEELNAPPPPEPMTTTQSDRLSALLSSLDDEWTAEVKSWWHERKFPKLADLNREQAGQVIGYIEEHTPEPTA